jgi:imidazoleglycerol phosphate synthase glutamine amidotransferase subunit HisH
MSAARIAVVDRGMVPGVGAFPPAMERIGGVCASVPA